MDRPRPAQLVGVLLIAGTLLLTACGGGGAPSGTGEVAAGGDLPTTAAPSRQGHPDELVEPLTGRVVDDEADARHLEGPALVVKVDNDPHARPQQGLVQADIVYELEVEGITRFAAAFHSTESTPVGPIRSARMSDIDLVSNLGRPLFAWSGANGTVVGEVTQAEDWGVLANLSHDMVPDLYWRDTSRVAPHNLYSDTVELRARADATAKAPHPVFEYREEGEELPDGARSVPGISITFRGDGRIDGVEYAWDEERQGWARFQTDFLHGDGVNAHLDASGTQIAPENVVVMFIEYTLHQASPQALTTGSGGAVVLTAGRAIPARWSRPQPSDPISLTTPEGDPIGLSQGRTWVALPIEGSTQYLSSERADQLLATS